MTKGIITLLASLLFLAACGAPPDYEGREVGDEDSTTDGGTSGSDSSDDEGDMSDGGFGNPDTTPGTGGSAGAPSTGGTGGNSGSGGSSGSSGAGGNAGSGSGGSSGSSGASGASGSGGSGGSTTPPDPERILSSLCSNAECLPDWTTGSFNGVDTGDALMLLDNRCGAQNGCTYADLNFDEFASCSEMEVQAHLGGEQTAEVARRFQRYADWSRAQALICLNKCGTAAVMTDEEVLDALCPPDLANFDECFRSVDPLTVLAPSSITPAFRGFADHRCLDSEGVPVSITEARDNVQFFLRAFRSPTAEQETELKGKLGQEIYSYFFQCFALSRTQESVR